MAVQQQRNVFTGRIIRVDVETVELPNGASVEFEIVRHPGGAATVAVNSHDEVCLLRHYRHAIGVWLWELPAGTLDSAAEQPLAAARRELQEETGLTATRWESLGGMASSPGVLTEVVHLFLASELAQHSASPERGEVFEIAWMPLQEAVAKALQGEISDGKTVVGICRAQQRLRIAHRNAGSAAATGLIK